MNRSILAGILIFSVLLTVCTTARDDVNATGGDTGHKYSGYAFDENEAQYYMSLEASAAQDGYYYISKAPVSRGGRFLHYFDMINLKSYPLCSKLDCGHDDEGCEAYLPKEHFAF